MTQPSRPDGLVLAGGRGRRVSGADKGLIELNGKPLAQHVAEQLSAHCDRVFICCNRNRDRYAQLGYPVCSDLRNGFEGPLAGIEAGLTVSQNTNLLVAPCDTPVLPTDFAARLIQLQSDGNFSIVHAVAAGRAHYLCALIAASLRENLVEFLNRGERAVHRWYEAHHVGVAEFDEKIRNLNDYESISALIAE